MAVFSMDVQAAESFCKAEKNGEVVAAFQCLRLGLFEETGTF
jgi:hypothetical protein